MTFSGRFKRDLHLGDQKVTWKKLEVFVYLFLYVEDSHGKMRKAW